MPLRKEWNDKQIKARLREAGRRGVNDTLTDAVLAGFQNAPVRTGRLRESIRSAPATVEATRIVGEFGSYGVPYAIFVEIGTRKMAGQFYIRRAADATFPTLGERIGANLR